MLMRTIFFYYGICQLFVFAGYGQVSHQQQNPASVHIEHLEIPGIKSHDQIIKHRAYTLSYNETHEQANWVAYELTADETSGASERSSSFYEDPMVTSGSATNEDYSGAGYDRGHLAPAGDMTWSPEVMHESFYYSNMSPQVPSFNRGIWKKLETQVRTWAQLYQVIQVVTGPVLTDDLHSIGVHNVSVPAYYYKVILDYQAPDKKAIGFLMANASSTLPLQTFAVNIDQIEKITGIDFFPSLPDTEEALLESHIDIAAWDWQMHSTAGETEVGAGTSHPLHESSGSVQCSGVTKKGLRCRNRTTNPSGRCQLHE
jgi:endonuclease G